MFAFISMALLSVGGETLTVEGVVQEIAHIRHESEGLDLTVPTMYLVTTEGRKLFVVARLKFTDQGLSSAEKDARLITSLRPGERVRVTLEMAARGLGGRSRESYWLKDLQKLTPSRETPAALAGERLVLCDFETEAELGKWGTNHEKGEMLLSEEHATSGRRALKFIAKEAGPWPGLSTEDFPHDWREYDFLRADVYNPQDHPIPFSVRIDDAESTDYTNRFSKSFTLAPGRNLVEVKLPGILTNNEGRTMMLDAVTRLVYFTTDSPAGRTFHLDNVRLEKTRSRTSLARGKGKPGLALGPAVITLTSGQRFLGKVVEVDEKKVRVRTAFASLELRRSQIKSIEGLGEEPRIAEAWRTIFNGRDLEGWTKEDGRAYVQDGALVSEKGADLFYPAHWTEFTLDCEIKGGGGESETVLGLGLAHSRMGRGASRVSIVFHKDGDAHVRAAEHRLWRSGARKFSVDDWMHVRLEITRDALKLYSGDALVGSAELSEVPVREGGVYFYSNDGHTARMRNVRVLVPGRTGEGTALAEKKRELLRLVEGKDYWEAAELARSMGLFGFAHQYYGEEIGLRKRGAKRGDAPAGERIEDCERRIKDIPHSFRDEGSFLGRVVRKSAGGNQVYVLIEEIPEGRDILVGLAMKFSARRVKGGGRWRHEPELNAALRKLSEGERVRVEFYWEGGYRVRRVEKR